MDVGKKFKLIIWKNYIIRKRHWLLTTCEIVIPILLFLLTSYGNAKLSQLISPGQQSNTDTPTYVESKTLQNIVASFRVGESYIYYAPVTNFSTEIIHNLQLKLSLPNDILKGFETEGDLLNYYTKNSSERAHIFAVVFDNNTAYEELPKKLHYRIRTYEKYLKWRTNEPFAKREDYAPDSGSENYFNSGFLALQMVLDICYTEMVSGSKDFPVNIFMQEFPYPPHVKDSRNVLYNNVLPWITICSFILLCPGVLQRIVEEKASGIKELMKMMGLNSWMLWCGWFLHAFFAITISLICIVIILEANIFGTATFNELNALVFLVFLFLFCCATISFIFAVSTLFNRPTMATIFCVFISLLSFIVPLSASKTISTEDDFHSNMPIRVLFCLLPNVAMVFGYRIIGVFELKGEGVHWNNLFTSPTGHSRDMTMGSVFLILLFDILLYSIITYIIDSINPGPYGIPKKWNCTVGKYFGKWSNQTDTFKHEEFSKVRNIEEPPKNLESSIVINNLKKQFHTVNAVNGLSMDIYKDQITILLGHNGAGKTTTMHILTGMIPQSSGSVKINGEDISENMDEIRKSLGLCTQHNLLFSDLTVKEQLMFFAMLRGRTKESAAKEAERYTEKMKIKDKLDVTPEKLSGGMKRKVCLGIALVGNARVLILDEPTSGLDPEARRDIWDMLLSERENKTMLITTHFLEEADVLGDRIAVMDHGNLLCYGTSMYLKNRYGTGYHLSLIRDENKFMECNAGCTEADQIKKIFQLISTKIPDVTQGEIKGNSVMFTIPTDNSAKFSELFKELELQQTNLGITGMSISLTRMEDVFLKLGSLAEPFVDETQTKPDGRQSVNVETDDPNSEVPANKKQHFTCFDNLTVKRTWALIRKRWLVMLRSKYQVTIQFLAAIFITSATILLCASSPQDIPSESALSFTLNSLYAGSEAYYSTQNNMGELQSIYQQLVVQQGGEPLKVSSVSEALLKTGVEDFPHYKKNLVVAAEFNSSGEGIPTVNAMYSNEALHGAPISLNLMMNTVLRFLMNDTQRNYAIYASNDPLPSITTEDKEEHEMYSSSIVVILWVGLFPFGLLFFTVFFVSFPLRERVSKIKQLQIMTGVHPVIYWGTIYLLDMASYLCVSIILTIIVGAVDTTGIFTTPNTLCTFFAIILCYGFSNVAFTYIFSYMEKASSAEAMIMVLCFLMGIIGAPIAFGMSNYGLEEWKNIGQVVKYVGFAIPHFSFVYACIGYSLKAVANFNWNNMENANQELICKFSPNPCCEGITQCKEYQKYFNFSSPTDVLEPIIFMIIWAITYFAIIVFMDLTDDCKVLKKLKCLRHFHTKCKDCYVEPDDVKKEEEEVYNTLERKNCHKLNEVTVDGTEVSINLQKGRETEDNTSHGKAATPVKLIVEKLRKFYNRHKAVDKVSFQVKSGECFGLLGVNGAGKSTTFKMLTWDEIRCEGRAIVDDVDMDQRLRYLNKTGYCPQVDAMNGYLSANELLTVFAELRGVPSEKVNAEVKSLIEQLGLVEYQHNPCKSYSGGNKRKLNIALALIGNPDVIFLDEPTSGVDPVSRRKLWDILTKLKKCKRASSFVLTSHSMEECETLCDRLAIMAEGKLQCIGEIPKLKQKFQKGFTVMLKLKCDGKQEKHEDDMQFIDEIDSPDIMPVHTIQTTNMFSGSNSVAELKTYFEDSELLQAENKDEHKGLLHYHIHTIKKKRNGTSTEEKWSWSELFHEMEELKRKYPQLIEDYSLSDTTLEQIFLSFTKENSKPPTEAVNA